MQFPLHLRGTEQRENDLSIRRQDLESEGKKLPAAPLRGAAEWGAFVAEPPLLPPLPGLRRFYRRAAELGGLAPPKTNA